MPRLPRIKIKNPLEAAAGALGGPLGAAAGSLTQSAGRALNRVFSPEDLLPDLNRILQGNPAGQAANPNPVFGEAPSQAPIPGPAQAPVFGLAPEQQAALDAASQKQQADMRAAIAAYLKQEEANVPQTVSDYTAAFQPELEKQLKYSAQLLGARGIGGAFGESGAIQELARKANQETVGKATLAALNNLQEARRTAGLQGLEAASLPAQFSNEALQRAFGLYDIGQQRVFDLNQARQEAQLMREQNALNRQSQLQLGQMGAGNQLAIANIGARSSKQEALIRAIASLLGSSMSAYGRTF